MTDAAPPRIGLDRGIQQERVQAAVPREVDEADQTVLEIGTDVTEGPLQDRPEVPVPGKAAAKSPLSSPLVTGELAW